MGFGNARMLTSMGSRKGVSCTWVLVLSVLVTSLVAAGAVAGAAATPEKEVVVYTPHDTDMLDAVIPNFKKKYGIDVLVVRGGTGEMLKRLEAEKDRPMSDVFWGGDGASLEAYRNYFEVYKPAGSEVIPAKFKSPTGHWTGFMSTAIVFMYNKKLVDEAQKPANWKDLIGPKWKGKVAFADASKSGSAFHQLTIMLSIFGRDEKGWRFVEDFVRNVKVVGGSSLVHQGTAGGEYHIGVTLEDIAYKYIAGGANVGVTYPAEGTTASPDGVALVKNAKHPVAARLFVDYVLSAQVQDQLVRTFYRRSVRPDVAPPKGLPATSEINIIEVDLQWSSDFRQEILKRWNDILIRTQ